MDVCSIHNLLKPCSVCADGEMSRLRARVEELEGERDRDTYALRRAVERAEAAEAERDKLAVEVLRVAVAAMDHTSRYSYPEAYADSMARNDIGNAIDDAVMECLSEEAYRAAREALGAGDVA